MAKDGFVPFVSPFGTARYPHVVTEDPKYGKYKIGVILDDEEADAIHQKCVEIYTKAYPGKGVPKNLNTPIKEDAEGVKYLQATSGYAPKVYDGKKKPLPADVELGGGSRVRIAGNLNAYQNGANKGVNFYLNDVQYTKLVARGSGGMLDTVEDAEDDADDVDTSDIGDADIDI